MDNIFPNLRRGSSTTATAESTTEAGVEVAGGTTLLAAIFTASVATLTGGTGTALALLTTEHTTRGGVRTLLLDVGGRDNLSGEVEPFAEVVKTLNIIRQKLSFHITLFSLHAKTYLGGEGVVVVLPRELGLDVATGVQRLASLDDL